MKLYTDGKRVAQAADADSLEQALSDFKNQTHTRIELRRSKMDRLIATRDEKDSCMLEAFTRKGVFGTRVPNQELGQVRASFQEFLSGYSPRLPWGMGGTGGSQGVQNIIIGDPFDDDCPLCQMEKDMH